MRTVIEIREPGAEPRRLDVNARVDIGREDVAVLLRDPLVSRRHASIEPTPAGLTVTDLASSNGTWLDGRRVDADEPFDVEIGAAVRFGDTVVVVISATSVPTTPQLSDSGRARLERRSIDGAVVHYRKGSAGERAVGAFVADYAKARRRLAGFGSEPWGTTVSVYLVDPFRHPSAPDTLLTSGSVVNARANELWFVVTGEVPPEPPERALALLFGSVLPAAEDIEYLLEGFGLHLANLSDTNSTLTGVELPSFDAAEGDLRGAMALSFVRFLIKRAGIEPFRALIGTAKSGQIEQSSQEILGSPMSSLEEDWRHELAFGEDKVNPVQFLRLSLRYLRPHRGRQIELGIYMLLSLAFTVSFPFISKRLFDTALPSGQFSQVLELLVILAVAFGVSLVAGLRQAYVAAYVGGAIVRDIRAAMFDRLQYLSIGWFGKRQQGDVLSRMFNDVAVLEHGISQTLRQGIFQVLSLIVSALIVLRLNLLLGAIVLVSAPVVGVVYSVMSNGAQRRSLAVQERQSSLFAVAAENYSAQAVVKAFSLENRERGRFQDALDRLFVSERRLSIFGGMFGLSVNLIVTILRLGVLGLGAWLVLHHRMTVGTLVAFLGVMGEVIGPVTSLTGIGQEIQTATGALVRVNEILEERPDIEDLADAQPCAPLARSITLAGVSFRYTSEQPTLVDLDIEILKGQRVAFVGPSGAGKSSVLQLLMRNYEPDIGGIEFDGVDIRSLRLDSLRGHIGVVFQDSFLFDTTIRENIAMGHPGATDAEIEAAARGAEVHEFIAQLPRGYDTLVGERGGRLSGGQRQRVAIARALLRNPTVLLLDEATSALDPRTERLINDTLERASAGRTTIMITHRLASIVNYDRIFVLDDGRLAESGTHAELVAQRGVYWSLWSEQTGEASTTVGPRYDAAAALARLAPFADLGADDLATIARGLGTLELLATQRLGEGNVYLLLSGKARVVAPTFGGGSEQSIELQPGDSFGFGALLGTPSGSELEAIDRVELAVLDANMLPSIMSRYPSVARMIEGSPSMRPESGQVLGRLTLGPQRGLGAVASERAVATAASLVDVARNSGVMRPVR